MEEKKEVYKPNFVITSKQERDERKKIVPIGKPFEMRSPSVPNGYFFRPAVAGRTIGIVLLALLGYIISHGISGCEKTQSKIHHQQTEMLRNMPR